MSPLIGRLKQVWLYIVRKVIVAIFLEENLIIKVVRQFKTFGNIYIFEVFQT